MKKTTQKTKTLVLTMAMAIGLLLPMTMRAQSGGSDNFFSGSLDNYDDRTDGINVEGISNYGIGEEVPLGSGLLIMVAAGAGYAVSRRRRNYRTDRSSQTYRHGAALLLVLAMTLTFTNCKKKVETIQNIPLNGMQITLNVDGGSKVIVDPTGHTDPNYATVTFESGDLMYVGNNGKYCGYLEYNGKNKCFSGTINPTSTDDTDYLHFYFMGNKGEKSEPSSVSITDQSEKYPVISYAHSKELYSSSRTSYSAKLQNYCAIVKFTTPDIEGDITITGMNNTVTVNFGANNAADATGINNNPYTPSKSGSGEIILHKVYNEENKSYTERWAILLEQSEVTTAKASASGYLESSNFTVPEIANNGYYSTGIGISLEAKYITGVFSVASGTTVHFSRGNLQYKMSTQKFSFMENQYSIVETSGDAGTNYSNYNIVSLFGWGTSGWSGTGAAYYQPYNTSTVDASYGKSVLGASLTGEYANADWGVYNRYDNQNKIECGGDYLWRILTDEEMNYLISREKTIGGISRLLHGLATVHGVKGLILLPDNWDGSVDASFTYGHREWKNIYNGSSSPTWSEMESAGAVFLPCAGYREGSDRFAHVGETGYYWTSTGNQNTNDGAYRLRIKEGDGESNFSTGTSPRGRGRSVRLVF